MTNPRVLLATLSVRTSAKGRQYLTGWLGKASVVAFEGEPDKFGNPTWDVFLSEPEPRPVGQKAPARPPERGPAARREGGRLRVVGAPPGASGRPPGHESETARRDRVRPEAAAAYGSGEDDLDDLPFCATRPGVCPPSGTISGWPTSPALEQTGSRLAEIAPSGIPNRRPGLIATPSSSLQPCSASAVGKV
jgi:hypothetical protein